MIEYDQVSILKVSDVLITVVIVRYYLCRGRGTLVRGLSTYLDDTGSNPIMYELTLRVISAL